MSWYESLRRRFGTLRWRIALWIAGFVALTLALLEVSVYFSMVQKLHGMVDDTLRLSAIQIAAAVDIEGGQIWTSEGLPELAPAASPGPGSSAALFGLSPGGVFHARDVAAPGRSAADQRIPCCDRAIRAST